MEKLTDKLFTVKYNEDTGKPHIEIVDQLVCEKKCTGKYCNHFCPAGVYEWNQEQKKNLVSFGNCIECGACSIGCPFDNTPCHPPRGGYGGHSQHGWQYSTGWDQSSLGRRPRRTGRACGAG